MILLLVVYETASGVYFHVSINQLTSTVPTELGQLSSVVQLYVYGNDFVGEMPNEICLLKNKTLAKLWANCVDIVCTCCKCCDDAPCPCPDAPCNTTA